MDLTITIEIRSGGSMAEAVGIIDMKGVMSLECEDPSSTEGVLLRVGQCWGIPWLN